MTKLWYFNQDNPPPPSFLSTLERCLHSVHW